MKIDFDPVKNARNIRERGLSFDRVAEFDFETAHKPSTLGAIMAKPATAHWVISNNGCMPWCLLKSSVAFESLALEKPTNARLNAMKPNPELIDDDNPEWTEADFKRAVPFSVLPEPLQATLSSLKRRGKQQEPTKVSTTVRFDSDVLDAFRATGRGWQTRMNEALKEWLKEHAA